MKLTKTGPYRTAAGHRAVILNLKPFIGYLTSADGLSTIPTLWNEDGSHMDPAYSLTGAWVDKLEANVDAYLLLDKRGTAVLSFTPPDPKASKNLLGYKKFSLRVSQGDQG